MRFSENNPSPLLLNPISIILPLLLIAAVACGESKTEDAEASADQESSAPMPENSNDDVPVDKIENAVFTDWDGNEVQLSDFRGKTVLIDFWETWCGPCLNAMPALDKLMNDYPEDFVVIAVSPGWSDSEEVVRRFIDEHDYSFVYVHDQELATALEIRGIPYKVYVDPQGKYIKNETGSRGPDREYEMISQIIEENR
jgi:thiol-disulfide isomerase/thioredoxin